MKPLRKNQLRQGLRQLSPQRLSPRRPSPPGLGLHLPATFLCAEDCLALPGEIRGHQKGWLRLARKPPRRLLHLRRHRQQLLLRPSKPQAHRQIKKLQQQVSSLPRRNSHQKLQPLRQLPAPPVQLSALVRRLPRPGRSPPANSATHRFAVDCLALPAAIHGRQKASLQHRPAPLQVRPMQARPTARRPERLRRPLPRTRILLPRLRSRQRTRLHSRIPTPLRQLRLPQREQLPLAPVQPVPRLQPRARTIRPRRPTRQISPRRTRSQRPPRRAISLPDPDCRSPRDRRSASLWPSLRRRPRTSRPRSL